MNSSHVIDAHALVWYLTDNPNLGSAARQIMSDPNAVLVLPAIALAEAVMVVEKKRVEIESVESLINAVDADRRLTIAPVTRDVVVQASAIVGMNDLHDRLIVATALVMQQAGIDAVLLDGGQRDRRFWIGPDRMERHHADANGAANGAPTA
ncbi:MAG TPA: PIN domain-containing protein [Tepidisphaeraceae bacterium]|nr:PIN domain-containing protein [Tepidisphaeraceae bacterium]